MKSSKSFLLWSVTFAMWGLATRASAEKLGEWPINERPSGRIILETAPLNGESQRHLAPRKMAPKASDGRVMRLLIKIKDPDTSWVKGIQKITFSANMPQHEHGMLVVPSPSRVLAPGAFAIDGVQFHMPGDWMIRLGIFYEDAHKVGTQVLNSEFQIQVGM